MYLQYWFVENISQKGKNFICLDSILFLFFWELFNQVQECVRTVKRNYEQSVRDQYYFWYFACFKLQRKNIVWLCTDRKHSKMFINKCYFPQNIFSISNSQCHYAIFIFLWKICVFRCLYEYSLAEKHN
jgi:hypothetical protein